MNSYERIYAFLTEMRRGPHDTAPRSKKYQASRDEYAERLKSVRKNIHKAGAKPSSLKKIRRKTGQDPMPKAGDLPKEMVGRSRGRTANIGGERTNPRAPAGTPRSGAFVLKSSGEGKETTTQKVVRAQAADEIKDQLRRKHPRRATASDLADALGAKVIPTRSTDVKKAEKRN